MLPPRDLYDIYTMIQYGLFDETQESLLKKCVMYYCAIGSDSVPEAFNYENISNVSQQRIKTDLIPVLRRGAWFDANHAHEQVATYLRGLLIPDETELSFWQAFAQKEYRPELLFQNQEIQDRIKHHPMAIWKCSDKQQKN